MPDWWLAVGPPEHWQIAFAFGKIWGLRPIGRMITQWEKLSKGDQVLFYATKPVSGIIGYGIIRTKFKQDKPLWPREVKEGKVIWPYRFEFDVEYCLPQDKRITHKVFSDYIKAAARGGFQTVKEEEAREIVEKLPSKPVQPTVTMEKPISTHDEVKERLVQLGKTQKNRMRREKISPRFCGMWYLIIQPILTEVRSLFFKPSPEAFLIFTRYLRYILRHDSYCSLCRRKVREYWKPILECLVDPIGMDQDLKPLAPVQIGCKLCYPSFFEGLKKEEKRKVFYIV